MALLELRGITKVFGTNVANDSVSLTVDEGEVLALVGENGAGKTTLMTICAGLQRPDAGQILFDGSPVTISSPHDAYELNIGMVHQHFKLVPNLTVAENVFLGRERSGPTRTLKRREMEHAVTELSERFGTSIDPTAQVDQLSVGVRQRVELLKALSHDTRLLILDEPTAVLTPAESDELFTVIRNLAAKGCAIVFITHKLGEVLKVADRVAVMRDGRLIDSRPAKGLSETDIARLMVGREVLLRVAHTTASPGDPILDVRDARVLDDRGIEMVKGLSLTVASGEIVGVAGVEGNGQSELAEAIFGLRPCRSGSIELGGNDITTLSVMRRRERGVAYIPEDRNRVGTIGEMSISDNAIATHTAQLSTKGWLRPRAVATFVRHILREYDVRGAIAEAKLSSLSGGNVQKIVIGREFSSKPKLLIAAQPTRGVDVGAMEYVHNAIVAQRDAGSGVLLLSADLNEVMSLSDRLVVFFRGQIIAEFTRDQFDPIAIGLAMAGIDPSQATAEQRAEVDAGLSPDSALNAIVAEVPMSEVPVAAAVAKVPATAPPVPADIAPSPWSAANIRHRVITGLKSFGQPLTAIILALVVGLILIIAIGEDPGEAYSAMFLSSFQSPVRFGAMMLQFVPLLTIAASVIISFRAGLFNIGGEGQLYLGALAGAVTALALSSLPGWILIPISLLVGAAAGALWGWLPGFLLAKWDVNIIVTTLMMSTIGVLLTSYLVTGPLLDPTAGQPATEMIQDHAKLPLFVQSAGIGLGLVIALVTIIVVGLVIKRSVWGLRLREVGDNPHFAKYTGTNVTSMTIQVMMCSGAIAGLAGAICSLGITGRFLQTFSPGYGFLGITIALLARLNPWASIIAALFYADMIAGSGMMQLNTNVPYSIVNVLQGIIIVFITAEGLWAWTRRRRRIHASDAPTAAPNAALALAKEN